MTCRKRLFFVDFLSPRIGDLGKEIWIRRRGGKATPTGGGGIPPTTFWFSISLYYDYQYFYDAYHFSISDFPDVGFPDFDFPDFDFPVFTSRILNSWITNNKGGLERPEGIPREA